MSDVWLLAQLVFGFAVILAPGAILARALGFRSAAATLAWALALVFAALAVTFVFSASLTLTLVLLLVAGLAALPFALQRHPVARIPWRWAMLGAGTVLGLLLWHVAGNVGGDGFFHLARIQKLLAFDDLTLQSANEFPDGGLHPGYAFPLWHGFLALVAKVSGADPVDVVLHGPTVLAALAVVVGFEAGWALFRRVVPAAASVAAGVAIVAMAPGSGGALTALALPATASRQLLVPAALALAVEATRRPTPALLASAAAASLALAVVHPTYALFLWIPFAGFLAVRWLWERRDARSGGLALAALVVPAGLFFAWLLPVIADTASVSPDARERERGFDKYDGQLDGTLDLFSVTPELFVRTGAVAVAALLLIPLAGLAARRRWAAYVVGGSLAVFVVCLVPWLFTPLSDVVSLSQSRRLAGFLPLTFALAGGMGVLARLLGPVVVPLALAAGIVFQVLHPGDFGYTLEDGGPAWATWVGVVGALVALVVGFRGHLALERTAALASALVLLPTYVHGFANWAPSEARPPNPLSDGLLAAVRERVPTGAVVYADPQASYRLGAYAPVRVCVNPVSHVADTVDNRPRERVREFLRFARAGDVVTPLAPAAPSGSSSTASAGPTSHLTFRSCTATRGGCSTGSRRPSTVRSLYTVVDLREAPLALPRLMALATGVPPPW